MTCCDSGGDIPQKLLVDCEDVSKLLSCSTEHVRRLSDAGKMPQPRRLGRSIRWVRSEIVSWVNAGCPSCK